MAKLFELSLLLIIIASIFAHSLSKQTNQMASCLTNNHVTNFSIFPTSQYHLNPTSYNNLLFFSLQNLRYSTPKTPKPLVIILPERKEQLVSSLLCSKKAAYEVRVRSGGHSYEAISSVSFDGKPFVIIDLKKLDKVTVDLQSETAWVQGGATLGQVYTTIAEQSKGAYGFSGGSCSTMGVGGHLLGGGFGLLSRKYGLAADNVVDALLVGPMGQVLDRASMGEDVFWAIRGGGGGSFGIVYAWKIKLLKVPPKVTGFQVSRNGNIENISQLVHKWQGIGPQLDDNFYLSVVVSGNKDGNETNVFTTFMGMYLGEKLEAISVINRVFPELRLINDECNYMSWIDSVVYFAGENTINDLKNRSQDKDYFKGKSDYVRSPIPIDGIRAAMETLTKEPKSYIIMDPYGGQMARIASDSIAFPHRKGNLYAIQYMVHWGPKDDINRDRYIAWIRGFYKYMTPFVSSNPRAAYVNYIDLDLGAAQDNVVDSRGRLSYDAVEKGRVWGEKYFLNNYDRLVKAKTIIDPCDFFHAPQGIPPALTKNNQCHSYY